jgi:hypothetical protein
LVSTSASKNAPCILVTCQKSKARPQTLVNKRTKAVNYYLFQNHQAPKHKSALNLVNISSSKLQLNSSRFMFISMRIGKKSKFDQILALRNAGALNNQQRPSKYY